MNQESDFYIGYLPTAPAGLRRFVRRVILALGLLALLVALVLSWGQTPFAKSYFEFGKLREFEGTLVARPYPTLIVSRPGLSDQRDNTSQYLLVARGKRGADDLIRGLVGKNVRLRGQLIYRDGMTIVQIEPGSIQQTDTQNPENAAEQNLGALTITGEIVDSKCYMGVMNPGRGKVHRDCASRCLSGAIPPMFIEFGSGKTFLLTGRENGALPYKDIKEFVAEPLTVHGEHLQRGNQDLLRIDPRELRHVD